MSGIYYINSHNDINSPNSEEQIIKKFTIPTYALNISFVISRLINLGLIYQNDHSIYLTNKGNNIVESSSEGNLSLWPLDNDIKVRLAGKLRQLVKPS